MEPDLRRGGRPAVPHRDRVGLLHPAQGARGAHRLHRRQGAINITDVSDYLTFFSRTLFVFGVAFEIPVFVLLLNGAGLLKGKTLAQFRPWIIVGTFIFAAVATPSADPFTMIALAMPMCLLFFLSEAIARYVDRRRARSKATGPSPDEASVL